ncbi:MFS transporter [Ancylobacter sp. TS-1]|uniref:MFS transporter n=1 Tax=Ancylobacter sp. TS-1 TaxID=1850374 RepID=UPI001390CA21|nr:MFS transporter [Ancylobacter sp. TS-1]
MTLSSSFGQTYFIGLFAPWVKKDFGLTDGGFGMIYAVATVASAATLFFVGRLADGRRLRAQSAGVLVALGCACMGMAFSQSVWMLLPTIFALRLFGQGLPGHLALTGVGRWFQRRRGRAMSLAVLGFPMGEALMPILAVALIDATGWRATWLAAGGLLCLLMAPLVLLLLRHEPLPLARSRQEGEEGTPAVRHWSRPEVLAEPAFYAVLAGVVAPSFVVTGIFFNQSQLAAANGWSFGSFAQWLPLYALVSVTTALATGAAIDRGGARRVLPVFLAPMALATLALALVSSPSIIPVFMVGVALTTGASQTLIGALWVELFGSRHLGAIRSVAFAGQVLASALAPGIMGLLLDAGVDLHYQYLGMVAYTLCSAAGLQLAAGRLRSMATA